MWPRLMYYIQPIVMKTVVDFLVTEIRHTHEIEFLALIPTERFLDWDKLNFMTFTNLSLFQLPILFLHMLENHISTQLEGN